MVTYVMTFVEVVLYVVRHEIKIKRGGSLSSTYALFFSIRTFNSRLGRLLSNALDAYLLDRRMEDLLLVRSISLKTLQSQGM